MILSLTSCSMSTWDLTLAASSWGSQWAILFLSPIFVDLIFDDLFVTDLLTFGSAWGTVCWALFWTLRYVDWYREVLSALRLLDPCCSCSRVWAPRFNDLLLYYNNFAQVDSAFEEDLAPISIIASSLYISMMLICDPGSSCCVIQILGSIEPERSGCELVRTKCNLPLVCLLALATNIYSTDSVLLLHCQRLLPVCEVDLCDRTSPPAYGPPLSS